MSKSSPLDALKVGRFDIVIDPKAVRVLPAPVATKMSRIQSLLRIFRARPSQLGRISDEERSFIDNQLFVYAERLVEEHSEIVSEIFWPFDAEVFQVAHRRGGEVDNWERDCWKALARAEAKVIARRKGTVRGGSRNGAQVCCTHVLAIYRSDVTTRWLLGLQQMLDRAVFAARTWFNQIVPTGAIGPCRRNGRQTNFELCTA
jgi:hypothetical protein